MREWHDVGVYVEPTSCAIQSVLANLSEHLQSPAFAALARHRTRHLAAPSQRALGLYLPANEVMLHVSVGPESEGDRQMLFDQLDLLHQRGIDFIIRCDSTRGWAAAQKLLRSGAQECWAYLGATHADKVATWELDGLAQMHIPAWCAMSAAQDAFGCWPRRWISAWQRWPSWPICITGVGALKKRSNVSNTAWGWRVSAV